MEVFYRREMRHNYLVIVPEQSDITGYECTMLANNGIHGLLKFHIGRPDGQTCFYYEITSKQPLSRMLEGRGLRLTELRSLIMGIAGVLAQIERYLLPEEQLLLEPDYIYVEPDSFRIYLCLVPCSGRDFPAAVEQLLQYLLGCVDHQDKECVVLAYGLYQECQKENFGIEDLLQLLRDSSSPEIVPQKKETTGLPEETAADRTIHQPCPDNTIKKNGWRMRLSDAMNRFSMKPPEENTSPQWESWQELLEEPEHKPEEKGSAHEPITVLLADLREKKEGYCLKALQPDLSDIIIESYPFVIGKNSSLADYHLDRETVSRLHVKIDRNSEGFQITDLNSTNGTKVRGRLLENNDSEVLKIGDEVWIAEWRYQFQHI